MNEVLEQLTAEQLDKEASAFDHHNAAYRDHSVEILDHIQATRPFTHTTAHGGFWLATKGTALLEITRNLGDFSSAHDIVIPPLQQPKQTPIHIDPPDLYDYRAILNPLFSPARMKARAAEIRALAAELMDDIVARGRGDVVLELAQPLTGRLTLRLLGIPEEDWPHYAVPMHELVYSTRPMEERLALTAPMYARLQREVRRLKEHPVPGSIMEYLHNVDMAGRKLRLDEIDSICMLMIGGGFDTTQALVGMAAVYLGRNPDRRQELVDEPDLIESATEEFLRVFPPTQGNSRRAINDVVVAGHTIKAGEDVFMSWVAANRDPDEFEDPHKIDFRRENNRHYSFGLGPHRCLGSHLARLEAMACLEVLIAKAPAYRLDEAGVEKAHDIGTVAGYNTVPIIV